MPMLSGIRTPFYIGAGALGPVLFGFSYDANGSYDLALIITGILCVISLAALVFLRPPKKNRDKEADWVANRASSDVILALFRCRIFLTFGDV